MDQSTHEHPRSTAALLGLLYCLSSTTVTSASPLQYRVKSSQRQVSYQHTIENSPRSVPAAFSSRSDSTESYVPLELTLEQHHQGLVTRTVRQPADSTLDQTTQSQTTKGNGYLRRLYDQFVGEDQAGKNTDSLNQNETSFQVDVNSTYYNETGESSVYTLTNETSSNSTEEDVFQPLRMRSILEEDSDYLTDPERESLFLNVLRPALLSWSSALRVDPVVGNLTVDESQLSPGNMCGPGGDSLPSVRVPLNHLTEGIPDTDIVVYLSLGFTSQRNKTKVLPVANDTDTDGLEAVEPLEGTQPPERRLEDENLELLPYQTNNSNTSFTFSYSCNDGDYLAAASYCSTDQYDRPTAALLHICIDDDFFLPSKMNRNARTIMHELGHALGFNSLSMAHFRRPDGTPMTPRGENGDIPDTRIECTGPGINRTFANVALPSEDILKFREVRGGVRVAQVVTPSVLQVVRNHFDCQELQGAELESGEGLPFEMLTEGYGCIGDHWERRLYSTDLMNPVVDEYDTSPRISTLTLAYFADSGWYQVDLNYAQVAAGWGRGSGCSFVNDTCIGEHGQVPPRNAPFFCNEIPSPQKSRTAALDIHGCTPDLSRKATCSIGQYEHELPPQFQYFNETYGANVGGSDPFLDYCPVYNGYANGLCSDSSNERIMKSSSLETFGTRNSRCLIGDLSGRQEDKVALCLPIACVVEDQTLRIQIGDQWQECREEGQIIQSGLTTIFCPNPQRICPTFYCPFDCLGTGGVCDYGTGECLCEYPGKIKGNKTTTYMAECGTVNETVVEDGPSRPALHFPIIRPGITIDFPPLDSPYNDYYVPDKKALEDKRPKARWAFFATVGAGVVALLLMGFFLYSMKSTIDEGRDDPPAPATTTNRNKDKMVATMLVHMRMQGREVVSNESLADTDEQLTESVASGIPSDAFSDVNSEALSDMDNSSSDMIPPTPPRRTAGRQQQEQQQQDAQAAIRRRKIAYA
ncbi:MAG: hypothetical protein SGBAC_003119 [Bacillariaceae sp.]